MKVPKRMAYFDPLKLHESQMARPQPNTPARNELFVLAINPENTHWGIVYDASEDADGDGLNHGETVDPEALLSFAREHGFAIDGEVKPESYVNLTPLTPEAAEQFRAKWL